MQVKMLEVGTKRKIKANIGDKIKNLTDKIMRATIYIHFSVIEVRTSRLDVLFLMFCARVKMSSSWGCRCSRSFFVTWQSEKRTHATESQIKNILGYFILIKSSFIP